MTDIEAARCAIKSIVNLPNASKEAKYYATVALSHLPPEEDNANRVQHKDKAPDLRS
jgi:hypothetical protein